MGRPGAPMRALTTLFLSLVLAVASWAQRADPGFDPKQDVTLGFAKGAVVVGVPSGAHLKAAFMAVAKREGPGTLTMGQLPPTTDKDELGDGIWHGSVNVPVSGEGLSGKVKLFVTYQPCTEGEGGVCYPPTTRWIQVPAAEIPASAPAAKPAVLPSEKAVEVSKVRNSKAPPEAPLSRPEDPAAPARTSLMLSLLLLFLAGMGASLTPCVYPIIPITMVIVGAKGGGKARGFALAAMLVLGMAVTYTTLGVLAARSGAGFGAFAQKPAFQI